MKTSLIAIAYLIAITSEVLIINSFEAKYYEKKGIKFKSKPWWQLMDEKTLSLLIMTIISIKILFVLLFCYCLICCSVLQREPEIRQYDTESDYISNRGRTPPQREDDDYRRRPTTSRCDDYSYTSPPSGRRSAPSVYGSPKPFPPNSPPKLSRTPPKKAVSDVSDVQYSYHWFKVWQKK